MNPLNMLFNNPVSDVIRAVVMPFKFIFVVGLCWFINYMTFTGTWWVKWVAFGMGIAVLVAWARAARTLLLLALVAAAGWWVYRHHGQAARERFDDWVRRTQPQQHQLFEVLRGGQGTPGFMSSK